MDSAAWRSFTLNPTHVLSERVHVELPVVQSCHSLTAIYGESPQGLRYCVSAYQRDDRCRSVERDHGIGPLLCGFNLQTTRLSCLRRPQVGSCVLRYHP